MFCLDFAMLIKLTKQYQVLLSELDGLNEGNIPEGKSLESESILDGWRDGPTCRIERDGSWYCDLS